MCHFQVDGPELNSSAAVFYSVQQLMNVGFNPGKFLPGMMVVIS